jgi:HEAT repeat protein
LSVTPLLAQEEGEEWGFEEFILQDKDRTEEFPVEKAKSTGDQKLLILLTEIGSPEVRAEAVKALGEIGNQEAVPFIGKSLQNDEYPHARYNAAWALGEIGGKEALSILKKTLKKEVEPKVYAMIAKSIERIESGYARY